MTLAYDIRTGALRGQMTAIVCPRCGSEDYGTNGCGDCAEPDHGERADTLRLLTAEGYVYVPRASVRLEEV